MSRARVHWLRNKLSRLFRRRRHEAALDTELRFHFDQLVAQFRAEGMPEREARNAALREFGATDAYREEIRDTWRPPALADLWRSVHFAARSLARTPGFTLVAIVTLALGVGANTSMFSLVNEVMLRPLPYPRAGELDQIFRVTAQDPRGALAVADYQDLVGEPGGYQAIAAYAPRDVSLSEPGQPAAFTSALQVSASFFSTLGVPPRLGRDFRREEEARGQHRVAILSERCWLQRFGGEPDIIGREVRIDGELHEVIGVLPAVFNDWRHLGWVDVFRPLGLTAEQAKDRGTPWLHTLGRRGDGVSPAEADGFIAGWGERLAREFPVENAGSSWRSVSLDEIRLGETGGVALTMLVGLSGFVLLIACSNLANFLLARTMARAREFAVRGALGATRAQLLRPLMTESLLLALAGGVCAVVVALWFGDWLRVRSTGDDGEVVRLGLDWHVLGWAFLASLVTAVLFGVAPALFALRLDLNATLKSGGRGTTGGRGPRRLRQMLIVGQFALALVLLTGAVLFVRGLNDLNNRRQGWQSDQMVTGAILLPTARYPGAAEITAFHDRLLERLAALPEVEAVSVAYAQPFFTWGGARKFAVEGQDAAEPGREPAALINGVSPGYFAAVGTPLLAGRSFTARDTAGAARVFIISEGMARRFFGAENPIGRRLAPLGAASLEWGEIVGVVRDVKSINPDPVAVPYQLYLPMAQEPRPGNEIAVRSAGAALPALVESIRQLMLELDADLPVRSLKPADERIRRANYQLGVLRDMLSGIALLGLGLASLGIYGVIARTMAQRSGEFGIRLALGAQVRDITRLVLGSGVKLALAGAGLGLFGAFGISRLLAAGFPSMVLDAASAVLGSTLVLIVVALVACYLPARQAARIDPVGAIRGD